GELLRQERNGISQQISLSVVMVEEILGSTLASPHRFRVEGGIVKKIFWFMLAALVGVSDAHAQAGLSDLRFSVFGGGSFLAANRIFTTGGDIFNTKYDSGPRFGARATASLTERVSFEASYSYGRNNLLVTTMRAIPVMRL